MSEAFAAALAGLSAIFVSALPMTGEESEPATEAVYIEPQAPGLVCTPVETSEPLQRDLTKPYEKRQYVLEPGDLCSPQ